MSGEAQEPPNHYFVLKNGEMFGPFSVAELSTGLSEGQFESRDFVQVEGQSDWHPLASVLGLQEEEMQGAIAPDWPCILKWAWWRLRSNLEEPSLRVGGICLAVGTLLLALSRWPFVFWIPWFLAAATAGALLVRRKHEGQGALLLVGVVGVPLLFLIFGPKTPSPHVSSAPIENPATPEPTPTPRPLLSVAPAPTSAAITKETPALPVAAPAPEVTPLAPPSRAIPGLATADTAPTATPPSSPFWPKAGKTIMEGTNKLADSISSFFANLSKPAAPPVPSVIDSLREHTDAFVIVKGDAGSGSGFICRAGTKTWLFTNIHVIADIKEPTITRLDGPVVAPGPTEVAAGPDVARIALSQPPSHPLELMTDLDTNVHIGDGVVVLGNSGGGGVVTSLSGKILGIGPDRLEVSAQFIPGNSGSPIIHVPTGKVIGIATYLTRRYEEFSDASGTGAVVVRRFGYRIDKVPAWEPVNWPEFYQEADRMSQISLLTKDVFNFLGALRGGSEPRFATETLRRPAEEWLAGLQSGQGTGLDRQTSPESFLNTLRFIVQGDVAVTEGRLRYTYFQNELHDEQAVRDRLYKAFGAQMANIPSVLNRPARGVRSR